ncbi:MAG: hypothetical protein AAFY34_10970 [Pseudomonadota bacterium]
MSLFEIHEILAGNRELIAQTWEFFINVHLAIIGIMYIGSHRVPVTARLVLILPYAAFMYMNYHAQLDNYTYAREILEYANNYALETGDDTLTQFFKAGWVLEYLLVLYCAAGAFGAAAILLIGDRRSSTQTSKVGE